jgi:hypothetical protein
MRIMRIKSYRIKKLIVKTIALLLTALLPAVFATFAYGADSVLVYRETTGQDVQEVYYYLTFTGGDVLIEADFDDEHHEIFTDGTLNTKKLDISFPSGKDHISICRTENRLEVSGADSRSIQVDPEVSWYQSLICLKTFVLSEDSKKPFYSLSSHFDKRLSEGRGIQLLNLVAKKRGAQTIRINGSEVETVRVLVTFNDIRSVFWKAYYWYRADDGQLVRYSEVRGGPGTPETVGVLSGREDYAGNKQ